MTVKELKERLSEFPDDMDVFVGEKVSDFKYSLINNAYVKEINFSDELDGEVVAREKVVILEDI